MSEIGHKLFILLEQIEVLISYKTLFFYFRFEPVKM